MALFIVRVELHGAAENDYNVLHDEMEVRGFSRTITSGKNIEYHLPTAEYRYVGKVTRAKVLAAAKEAANKTDCEASILVTEAVHVTWSGLDHA